MDAIQKYREMYVAQIIVDGNNEILVNVLFLRPVRIDSVFQEYGQNNTELTCISIDPKRKRIIY